MLCGGGLREQKVRERHWLGERALIILGTTVSKTQIALSTNELTKE